MKILFIDMHFKKCINMTTLSLFRGKEYEF